MAVLKERHIKIREDKDLNAKNLERMIQAFDDNFRQLDSRRISQITSLDSGASLSDVVAKVNEIIASLNASDLSMES
jgi:hypothetical protein